MIVEGKAIKNQIWDTAGMVKVRLRAREVQGHYECLLQGGNRRAYCV